LGAMRKNPNDGAEIHECSFEGKILHTNATVKFSCKMFVAWKNMTNKTFCKTLNNNVTIKDGIAKFDENLTFQTYMIYDKNIGRYVKK
jgi:hypothetical protein